jgi:hypothetical protein
VSWGRRLALLALVALVMAGFALIAHRPTRA